jgi:hypothetical protein
MREIMDRRWSLKGKRAVVTQILSVDGGMSVAGLL